MGIFTRHAPAPPRWQPTGVYDLHGSEADMCDVGQAVMAACAVTFERPDLPGCQVTIWTYAAQSSSYEKFVVGARYRYEALGWSLEAWADGIEERDWPTPEEADQSARFRAHQAMDGLGGFYPGILAWDGQPVEASA